MDILALDGSPPTPEIPESLFPKLPPGRTKRTREETADNQRNRLMAAMVDVVDRNGYRDTTLRELVALAGVSNTSFYQLFPSVEDCFLATYDELVGRGIEQVLEAFKTGSSGRERLRAAFAKYVELAIRHPAATHLVIVDSLGLGERGVAHRRRSAEADELLFARGLEELPGGDTISELTIRGIVGGFHRIVYRRVREGKSEQLRDCIDPLLDWSLSYIPIGGASRWHLPSSPRTTPRAGAALAAPEAAPEMWDERADSIASRLTLSQRERIVRAAAMVVAEKGYEKLSIPAITSGAGVSNQTFYEYFQSAHDAFLEAYDLLDQQVLARVGSAMGTRWTWSDMIIAGFDALLRFTSEKPLLSRIPFIESLAAGADVLDRIDRIQDRLLVMFDPEAIPPEVGQPSPEVVLEAIAGGIFAVIQHEVLNNRSRELPALLPELSYFAIAPATAARSEGTRGEAG